MRAKKQKPVKAWAVFSDDKLLVLPDPYADGCQQYQIYKKREHAKHVGEDYRRVLIVEG